MSKVLNTWEDQSFEPTDPMASGIVMTPKATLVVEGSTDTFFEESW